MNKQEGGSKTRVLILGGGHAGFRAARRLLKWRKSSSEIEVVVVSGETSEVYHGLMPAVVGGKVQARNLLVPLRHCLKGMIFYNYEVERIDLERKKVFLDPAAERAQIVLSYDYLIIALGSVTDLTRFPGLQEHGLQTKTVGDVYHLHDHLLQVLEKASVEQDALERKRLLTVLIVGAGYAGVEIGAEANSLIRSALRFYPNISPAEVDISIISSGDRILAAMHQKLAADAARFLLRKGVRIRLSTNVRSVNAGEAVLSNGERIPTRTVIVTVGIAPNPVIKYLGLEHDRGRLTTDEYCRVKGQSRVYAVGDNAAVPHVKTGLPCAATALYAFTQGTHAADNIIAEMEGKPLRRYSFHNFGEIAQLGGSFGLVQLFGIPFSGFLPSLLVHLTILFLIPSWRCRLGLIADRISNLMLPPDVSQMRIDRSDLMVPLRFAAGQDIIRQGEPGSRFYIVNSGKVEVVRRDGTEEQSLAFLGPGTYFGEIALLQSSYRTATVRAVEDTTVLSIARKDFKQLVDNFPHLAHAMSQTTRAAGAIAVGGDI